MNKCVLVDRGALIQLALPSGPSAAAVDAKLSQFDLIAVETGGASALRGALSKRDPIRGKLYVVDYDDYAKATSVGFEFFGNLLEQAVKNERVRHELRRYTASRRELSEESNETIKYIFKLFFLAYALDASLFLANYRFALFCSVVESVGGSLVYERTDAFDQCVLQEPCRLFEDYRMNVKQIRAFSVTRAAESGTRLGVSEMTDGHIFLSYCHDNAAEVQRLYDDLTSRGLNIWWDRKIAPGQDWKFEINRALRSARGFVLCLSHEAASRPKSGLFPEALDAISRYREYQPGSIFIVPIRLSTCQIPMIAIDATRTLDAIQYVDLFPEDKRDAGIDKLSLALKSLP